MIDKNKISRIRKVVKAQTGNIIPTADQILGIRKPVISNSPINVNTGTGVPGLNYNSSTNRYSLPGSNKSYSPEEIKTVTQTAVKNGQTTADALKSNEARMANLTSIANIAGSVASAGSQLLAANSRVSGQSAETQMANGLYDTATGVLASINPIAGGIAAVGGFVSDGLTALGLGTDQMTSTDKILDSKFMKLTPVGLVNAIGAKKTRSFGMNQDTIENVGGSYGGSVSGIQDAAKKANKKYGLFSSGSRKKANALINEMERQQNIMTDIAQDTKDRTQGAEAMSDIQHQAYDFDLSGGYDQRYNRAAKNGMKIPEPDKWEPELIDFEISEEKIDPGKFDNGGVILDQKINPETGQIEDIEPDLEDISVPAMEFEVELISNTPILKSGGTIEKKLDAPEIKETEQKNLIPEGALHKNKHHIEDTKEFTQKGIPVIDKQNDQQAEIEKEEIIFTKEVTDKLEELYKLYYSDDKTQKEKDNAAIEAGKLLTKEIMLNTDDRAGLMDKLKNGGAINTNIN